MTKLMTPARVARGLALVATPALTLGLMTSAAAANAGSYYVGQNTASGATVVSADGSTSHSLSSQLRAVAGDGSVHVLSAKVTPTRTAAVLVDGDTGIGRIVNVDPKDGELDIYAGNGAVLVRVDSRYSLFNVISGKATRLSSIPASETGSRAVTALTGTSGGALVATADVTPAGSSGEIRTAHIWKLTASGATQVATVEDQRIVAVAAAKGRIDAILAANGDDALTHMTISATGTTRQSMNLALTPDIFNAELGYAHQGDLYSPVLALTGVNGTTTYTMTGQVLKTYKAGSRVFISAEDLRNPTSISNRLTTLAFLDGVRNNQVISYGGKVTPRVSAATGYGLLPPSAVPAKLAIKAGGDVRTGTSGKTISLTRNTCFIGSAAGTQFVSPAAPVTRCVDVKHRLAKVSYDKRNRATVVATSADTLQVQLLKKRRWDTVKRVSVNKGRARFTAPRGEVRAVAVATRSNVANTLLITRR